MSRTIAEINRIAYDKIEQFYEDSEDFRYFIDDYGNEDWDNWEALESRHWRMKDNVILGGGASRGVLIFKDFNWVVKFNFLNEMDGRYDFCEGEVNQYKIAKKNGMQKYFAEIWRAGDFYGRPFYLMEKAVTDYVGEDMNSDTYRTDNDYRNRETNMNRDDAENIVNFFSNYYEKEEVLKLLDYCDEHNIFDIYDSNVGYIDEEPVFIDYAGY